jgi:hypothetical protein
MGPKPLESLINFAVIDIGVGKVPTVIEITNLVIHDTVTLFTLIA